MFGNFYYGSGALGCLGLAEGKQIIHPSLLGNIWNYSLQTTVSWQQRKGKSTTNVKKSLLQL